MTETAVNVNDSDAGGTSYELICKKKIFQNTGLK
jgi:hypothetical protein